MPDIDFDPKEWLTELGEDKEPKVRTTIYVKEAEWKKFQESTTETGSSRVLERFIIMWNKKLGKKA